MLPRILPCQNFHFIMHPFLQTILLPSQGDKSLSVLHCKNTFLNLYIPNFNEKKYLYQLAELIQGIFDFPKESSGSTTQSHAAEDHKKRRNDIKTDCISVKNQENNDMYENFIPPTGH